MMIDNGGSIRVIPRIRPSPKPPSWVVREVKVCESFPINFHYFVIWFLVVIYVVRFVSLFENLVWFYVIEYVWIYVNMDGYVKPGTWLAIRVAEVTASKSDYRVFNCSCWSLVGVRCVFPLIAVMILKLMI
ncbi:unnamed protein product [Cuscuta epithymum]|uniref:Uncharacterized protein n=1 Tax=Cuscuta epithymum TaxID=186058 RepID=A0AAV0C4N1_9ASTE|nr:unnamed protein product [Cuscuta epithymum]